MVLFIINFVTSLLLFLGISETFNSVSQENLISLLESGIELLKRAERYEVIGAVYKIAIPLYEEDREFSVVL